MNKMRKILIMLLFALIVMTGVNTETANIKAASAKNFKGDLNATYKNSKSVKSSITFKKVNSKKVSVKIVVNGLDQGKFNGKIISKDTIQMKLDGGEKVQLKWKDKSTFTAKRPSGGFSEETIQMARTLCYALQNKTYTAKTKSSNTVYYSSKGNPYKSVISIKGNKITVKGKLTKGTKKSYGEVKGRATKTKTFELAKNVKFYGNGGEDPKPSRIPYNNAISSINNKEGLDRLPFILTVKNGKVTRIDFYS